MKIATATMLKLPTTMPAANTANHSHSRWLVRNVTHQQHAGSSKG